MTEAGLRVAVNSWIVDAKGRICAGYVAAGWLEGPVRRRSPGEDFPGPRVGCRDGGGALVRCATFAVVVRGDYGEVLAVVPTRHRARIFSIKRRMCLSSHPTVGR